MEKIPKKTLTTLGYILFLCFIFSLPTFAQRGDTVVAEIAAIDQPLMYNRMGTVDKVGLMYALKSDITLKNGHPCGNCSAGNVMLNENVRPRPLVIRANKGNIIKVVLTNWVESGGLGGIDTLPYEIGFSANGLKFIDIGNSTTNNYISSNGSYVGSNQNNQVRMNETKTYYLLAKEEGSFLIRDPANTGTSNHGLFGSITVHPENAEWYRSQVTQAELEAATMYYVDSLRNNLGKLAYTGSVPPGFPVVDYDMLKMYREEGNTRHLIHADLTAIITGRNAGKFDNLPGPLFNDIPASPNRRQPYREFSITYHNSEQTNAFDLAKALNIPNGKTSLLQGQDEFSINYGNAGITNEIYSNRIQKGPAADCVECAYEEFFLSSWVLGDPAMPVDKPVNSGIKATKALYPDDPSNVYHSYMNDHVKFRINHASLSIPHVHHQHAHQWLHSPNSPDGHYMDSQTIIPGSSWTLEMVYNGSGNRNKTVGDNIFHCHFYPHFAGGMWALWRVHDVLEMGTILNGDKQPATGSRALPDAEIKAGTPIPGLVPLPTIAMPSLPGKVSLNSDGQVVVDITTKEVNPGFPFFIPGIAGKRAPHPPMDFAIEGRDTLDGGLPRHLITDGDVVWQRQDTFDWTKVSDNLSAIRLPEEGTPIEILAMNTHAQRRHPSVIQNNTRNGNGLLVPSISSGDFILNGLPPAQGAPFAAPYVDDEGNKVADSRKLVYKAADIQMDVVLNKAGWHYPQQRMIALWGDVKNTINGIRPPEPFFFRANSKDYIEFWQTNLIPDYYESDDFQVRTPTDIIGQHIHLVKFDVTSSDGAANGWNYEDGTFSPDAVRERIKGIKNGRKYNWYEYNKDRPVGGSLGKPITVSSLQAKAPNPEWGKAPANQNWHGAQTTVQLWYADPLLNIKNEDRTVRTVFTHDHFGPSTHQQIGLYAGLLVEPEGSTWLEPVSGNMMYNDTLAQLGPGAVRRTDGGPTSFQANIIAGENGDDSYREFALEFQDMQLAYTADSDTLVPYPYPDTTNMAAYTGYRGKGATANKAINPPSTPQIVSAIQPGTYSINYRNEPLFLRVGKPGSDEQESTLGGDLSYVFSSKVTRANPLFNKQPTPGSSTGTGTLRKDSFPKNPLTPGMQPGDPFTPLLRAYEGDNVQVRTLVGAHEADHVFGLNGLSWLFEPSNKNSGYRSTQIMGLSEHFEMLFSLPKGTGNSSNGTTDYLYNASKDHPGNTAGIWGLLRAYNSQQTGADSLTMLPNNNSIPTEPAVSNTQNCGCPPSTPLTARDTFYISAVSIKEAAPGADVNVNDPANTLLYNEELGINDPNAMIFVENKYLEKYPNKRTGKKYRIIQGRKVEPLVLRSHAGNCITIQLTNRLLDNPLRTELGYGTNLQTNITASTSVGLHTELLSYNVNKNDGYNVGLNDVQTITPTDSPKFYTWYAGILEDGQLKDAELGSVLLTSADPLEQYARGLFGAIIIEPKGSTWTPNENSNAAATIHTGKTTRDSAYREFVIFLQNNLGGLVKGTDPNTKAGTYAINYKQEPLRNRGLWFETGALFDMFSNNAVNRGGSSLFKSYRDPETPVFAVEAGTPTRIRLLQPGGTGTLETFILEGHGWQEEPYTNHSKSLGDNKLSQYFGSRSQLAAMNNFDLLIDAAGGEDANGNPGAFGDYLYRTYQSQPTVQGAWGLMRVMRGASTSTITQIETYENDTTIAKFIKGVSTVDVHTGKFPEHVYMYRTIGDEEYRDTTIVRASENGAWTFNNIKLANIKTLDLSNHPPDIDRRYSVAELEALEYKGQSKIGKLRVPSRALNKKKEATATDNGTQLPRKKGRKISSKQE